MDRFWALTVTELRLVFRNRTVAFGAILLPIAFGVLFFLGAPNRSAPGWAAAVSLQLAVVLAMTVYSTVTLVVVTRRESLVLKRLRTSELSDRAVLAAVAMPAVLLGVLQLAVFAAIDVLAGAPLPANPLPLVLAVLGGLALAVTAGIATATVTSTPERVQITIVPLLMLFLGCAFALPLVSSEPIRQAIGLLPGGILGAAAGLAYDTASPVGVGGLPAILVVLAAALIWPALFGLAAARRFRWERRV